MRFFDAEGKKCRDPGSNRGPLDLQSNALPTELSRPACLRNDVEMNKPPDNRTELSQQKDEVPPRFELGSLDSESRVLTITPWDLDMKMGRVSSSVICYLLRVLNKISGGLVRDLNPGPLAP